MLNMEPTIKPVVMGRLLNKRDTAIKIAEIKIDKKKFFWGNPAWHQPAFFDLFVNRLTVLKNSAKAPITLSSKQTSNPHGPVPNLLSI
jgi:hypothetical protein